MVWTWTSLHLKAKLTEIQITHQCVDEKWSFAFKSHWT